MTSIREAARRELARPVAAYDARPGGRHALFDWAHGRGARDEVDMPSIDSICKDIHRRLEELPGNEAEELFGRLVDMLEEYTERGSEDRNRRRAADQPEPFGGRPNPGGRLDPLDREVADRRRRLAGDARYGGLVDFDEAFPDARRIRTDGAMFESPRRR